MNVLFLNPYIYDFTAYDLWVKPLGLLYLASVVKKYTKVNIHWLDVLDRYSIGPITGDKSDGRGHYTKEIQEKPEIFKKTPRNYSRYGVPKEEFHHRLSSLPKIDLVFATSLMTYWIDGLKFSLSIVKDYFPKAKIILGGIIPSLFKQDIIKQILPIDIFIAGYGENQILNIISNFQGKVIKHPDLSDLNNIPFPAFEFLSNKKVLPVLTSRGCPYKCTYCASRLLNKEFIERPSKEIVKELVYHYQKYNTKDFIIFDDAFLVNKKTRILPVLSKLSKILKKVSFHTPNGIHTKEIDLPTAQLFYQCGFKTINLSFESIRSKTLQRSSNKVSKNEMEKAVENLETAGYKRGDIGCYLLFGAPWQNLSEIEESLEFVKNLGIKPNLAYYSPVPKTIDYQQLVLNKKLMGNNFYETNKIYFLYHKSPFNQSQIKHIKKMAFKIRSETQKNLLKT